MFVPIIFFIVAYALCGAYFAMIIEAFEVSQRGQTVSAFRLSFNTIIWPILALGLFCVSIGIIWKGK
jgi:hypothetical protein